MADNGRKRIREQELYRLLFHPGERFRESELYRSVVRHPRPDTPRGRAMTSFHNFFLHVYPVKIPRKVLSFRSTGRLGFIATVLFAILFVSGMYLMFFYRPSIPDAYLDMHEIHTRVAFGQFMRNIHRWAAHLMVVVVFVHMLRVFYAGAYRAPRQFNWMVGVVLLLLTLGLSFTGYLLPWDQLAFWAITVGTTIAGYVPLLGDQARQILLGGPEVGGDALLRFYVLHIYALPTLIALLLAVHVWRVRKDGFAVADREEAGGPEAVAAGPAVEAVTDA
ncbi:MAG TPA: cytochrome b N-terminal domain-containing protein [Actinomycetota bacterium]|nr:cytochrome b N-terminal domain-containing protein [Actinomycetota bacterium]